METLFVLTHVLHCFGRLSTWILWTHFFETGYQGGKIQKRRPSVLAWTANQHTLRIWFWLAHILIWRCVSGGSSNQRVGVLSSSCGCMSAGNFLISAPSVFKWLHDGWALKMGHWRRWWGGRHMAWQPTSVISVWMSELMGELGKCCKAHWGTDEVFGWWGESKWTEGVSTTPIQQCLQFPWETDKRSPSSLCDSSSFHTGTTLC